MMSEALAKPGASALQRLALVLLTLLLIARLGWVLFHQPLAGFANQFDMLRTTGCLGLQPQIDVPAGAATHAGPVALYRVDMPRDPSCLPSTEVAIAGLARGVDWIGDQIGLGDPQTLSLRLVACTRAFLLLLTLLVIDRGLRAFPRARIGHLAVAALILVDPLNSLYLAGFYTEFAALLSAWWGFALPLIWLLRGRFPGTLGMLGWGLALAALALSRFQHLPLPFLLMAWLAVLARTRAWPLQRLALPLLLLIPALLLQLAFQGRSPVIAQANTWNSFFGAALPAAGDAIDFVDALQLPAACAQLVHTSWYLRRGRDARAECPQAFELSRVHWALLLAREPAALARLLGRGVAISGQWRPAYLGEIADGQFARLPVGRIGLGASFSEVPARLPFWALTLFWGLPLLLGGVACWQAATRSHGSPSLPVQDWLLPMLAAFVLLGWAASIVGDGYSELARHLHLAGNAALLALILGVFGLFQWLRAPRQKLGPRVRWLIAGGAAVLLILLRWAGSQALAFGVLDQPATEIAANHVVVSGWALDPRGIAHVDALFADGSRQRMELHPKAEIATFFGAGVGHHARAFSGQLDLNGPAPVLAIEVIPLTGAATVIDRRWFRPH